MFDNDNNMSMYCVNNNSSSSSISLTREEVFIKIKDLVSQYRIDQEMRNDGNNQYYAIMCQSIHREFAGDFLSSKNNFSENVIDIVDKLKDEVKTFNKFMWFDYGEIREKKLSEKEDLLHSFYTLLKMKSPSKDPDLNQINNYINAQLLIIESKILTESEL
jgi:hypothetical protein